MCLHAVSDVLESLKIWEIEAQFDKLADSDRDAAEIAFAIAYHYMRLGDKRRSKLWADRSIAYFNRCNTNNLLDCEPVHQVIAGVRLPDFIHERVVEFHVRHYWRLLD